jgi:hypothetical protein
VEDETDLVSPYCPECKSCGEDGCCPPTKCTMSKDGLYCKYYLSLLKATYQVHIDIYPKLSEEMQNECIDKLFKLMKENNE